MLALIASLLAAPGSILLSLLSIIGLASWPRQIVRVVPRAPGRVIPRGVTLGTDGKGLSLVEWVKQNVPSLEGAFKPSWWLPSGHLQTIFSVIGDFSTVDPVRYTRTYLRTPDGGTLGLDFTPIEGHHAADSPLVVVCHGLTGGSYESYVRNVLAWVIRPATEGGMGGRAVVVNFRGCAGVPVTSPQLYSAGTTVDLSLALHYLRAEFPLAPLHGIGFSLGASVLSRYLGETGSAALLSSGIVLGTPWNLPGMSVKLEGDFITRHVYSRAMAGNLIRLFERHHGQARPRDDGSRGSGTLGGGNVGSAGGVFAQDADFSRDYIPRLLALKSKPGLMLRDVDDVLTSRVGGPKGDGLWPFADAGKYYEWASSYPLLGNVARPMLAINAFDDPIIDGCYLPVPEVESASHVLLAVTGGGGHLGWFDGPFFSRTASKRRWILKPVSQWLTAAARDLGPAHPGSVRVRVETDELGPDDKGKGEAWVRVVNGGHALQGGGKRGWRVLDEGEVIKGEDEEESGVLQGL